MRNVSRFLSPEMLALARAKLDGKAPSITVHIGPESLIPIAVLRKYSGVSALVLRRAITGIARLHCITCQKPAGKRACGCFRPRWGIQMRDVEAVVREAHRRVGKRLMGE